MTGLFVVGGLLLFLVPFALALALAHTGDARGNAGAQFTALGGAFAAFPPGFRYDAEVHTVFPRVISGGVSWQCRPRLRLAGQLEWVNWSQAFDRLPIFLTNGDNASINGVAGGNTLYDTAPLNWKDQVVVRLGADVRVSERVQWRAGYSYGKSPVPDGTLTPMTAAIMEHTIGTGFGLRWKRYTFDLAYQWDVDLTRSVGASVLKSGEFSNSSTHLGVHWFALTVGRRF